MGVLSFTLMRPSALLCASLVLLAFLFPETCEAGKNKVIPPVKHLFGVGIGYQKVVHYKPVLVFSKSRRVKQRRPGWGWSGGGGGGGGGGHKYTPIVVKENIHKHGKSGYPYSHPPPQQHRRKRKRQQHPHREHSSYNGGGGGRGWGWRQGWRRPHRSHRKGHGGGHRYHNLDSHLGQIHHGSGGGGGDSSASYEYPHRDHNIHNDHHHHEISDYPSTEHHHDNYGGVWGGTVGGGGRVVYPSHSSTYYGSPYSSIEDIEDEPGGYESEIKEQWKKNVPISPSVSPPDATPSPTPSQFPFTEHPPNDASVTSIQKDFLKNHMKNFNQFQEYQQSTTNEPRKDHEDSQFAPYRMRPPGPFFSTTDPQNSEAEERENPHYVDEYSEDDIRANHGGENYDDYNSSNDLNRKMMPIAQQSTQITTTIEPNPASNTSPSRGNFQQIITAMPKIDKAFKPSPRVDDRNNGSSFSKPGFFPTFEQFKQIKMT